MMVTFTSAATIKVPTQEKSKVRLPCTGRLT
jgi:hypothetical protein